VQKGNDEKKIIKKCFNNLLELNLALAVYLGSYFFKKSKKDSFIDLDFFWLYRVSLSQFDLGFSLFCF